MQGWFNTKKPVKPGVVAHGHKPTTWEIEAKGPGVQGYPCLYSQLDVSLGYMRACLKKGRKGETN